MTQQTLTADEIGLRAMELVGNLTQQRDDLLEALEACERWFVRWSPLAELTNGGLAEHPMLAHIRAAIAKARGE